MNLDRPAKILCLHGPNLNMLGTRQPEVYGSTTLDEINQGLQLLARDLKCHLTCRQSNHEGALVDWIQEARGHVDILLINPGAYTHTSIAIRDAILASEIPCFEIHLSNVYQREPFRHKSYIADISVARVMGFGPGSYNVALLGALTWWEEQGKPPEGIS